jgi:hypothetical protein
MGVGTWRVAEDDISCSEKLRFDLPNPLECKPAIGDGTEVELRPTRWSMVRLGRKRMEVLQVKGREN